jgi:hypothetical protein
MLKMKCSNCGKSIASSLLTELETVLCSHCRQTVPVENVFITAGGFTICRDDLLKRIFRYQQLLREVVKERELMEQSEDISPASKRSTDRFLGILEELLTGARKNFRLRFSNAIPLRLTLDHQVRSGRLINLSIVGACIELDEPGSLPRRRTPVMLEFLPADRPTAFFLAGTVAWVNKGEINQSGVPWIGIKFNNLVEDDRAGLWQFIAACAAEENGRKSP